MRRGLLLAGLAATGACAPPPVVETALPPPPAVITELLFWSARDVFEAAEFALTPEGRKPTRDFSRPNRWRISLTADQVTAKIDVEIARSAAKLTVTCETSSVLGDGPALQAMAAVYVDRIRELLTSNRLENPYPRDLEPAGPKASATLRYSKGVKDLFDAAKKGIARGGFALERTSISGTHGWWLRARGKQWIHVDFVRRTDETFVTVAMIPLAKRSVPATEAVILDELKKAVAGFQDEVGRIVGETGKP